MSDQEIHVKVIGYYGHYNAGDEQYRQSFVDIFAVYAPTLQVDFQFIDCDQLLGHTFRDDDIIVLGGGDILNEYFMRRITAAFQGRKNRVIAVSVGLPYTEILTKMSTLELIDYIFIRTRQDLEYFGKYFHPHRVMYLPDISYILMRTRVHNSLDTHAGPYIQKIRLAKSLGHKVVGVCLSRHVYHKEYLQLYKTLIAGISHFVKYLTNFGYHVVLLPFNTNESNDSENDILIQNDILDSIQHTMPLSNMTVVNCTLGTSTILNMFELFDVCVPMRFHACLFSVYTRTPFLPIFTTRKIRNLLVDCDWMYGYELPVNDIGIPTELDLTILMTRFVGIMDSIAKSPLLQHKLARLNEELFGKEFNTTVFRLIDILTVPYPKGEIQSLLTTYKSQLETRIHAVYNSVQQFAQTHGYADFRNVDDPSLQDTIVSIVSYHLTQGSVSSAYNYGLKTKMFTGSGYLYHQEWRWILDDFERHRLGGTCLQSNPFGLFNIGYVDQVDYSGSHRSGWQYVYDNIKYLHNESSNLYLDMYVDRTFHWHANVNRVLGLIPYTRNWIGFIHHTFDTSFSDYNCYTLLASQSFRDSLVLCKGLFVLSNYLQAKLTSELCKIGFAHVPVFVLMHPTDMDVEQFTLQAFCNNPDKKIMHIGGWLRNTYTFYTLTIPQSVKYNYGYFVGDMFGKLSGKWMGSSTLNYRKVALLGKHMNNYYPPITFLHSLHDYLVKDDPYPTHNHFCSNHPNISSNCSQHCSQNVSQHCSQHCSQNVSQHCSQNVSQHCSAHCGQAKIKNNWYRFLYDDMCNKIKSVDKIEYLDNCMYDKLLTENIVCIHLVDASAVNTVIECFVRNTPIIVNKHPAVVEVLGDAYPLYFSNDGTNYVEIGAEVKALLQDSSKIKQAYHYLRRQDKHKVSMQLFIKQFTDILKTL